MLQTAMYLSPMAQRRAEFGDACASLFARLHLADSADVAASLLAREQPDLLVIDLDRFEPSIDLEALGGLVARRAGAPVLLLCPFAGAAWLPALMAYGPARYAVAPLDGTALRAAVGACLVHPDAPSTDAAGLRTLLDLRTRVQAALEEAEDAHTLADGLCAALSAWPGVLHAAVFLLKDGNDLQLEAQHGPEGLLLGALLQRTDRLLQAPLRHAFPGLLAAAGGTAALIEVPEQSGEPALAEFLRAHGAAMALGVPIPADGPGTPRGALSLLFGAARAFTPDEWATLHDVARLAAFGLRLVAVAHENDHLLARLTYISTTDALTGVANRRHGEELLEKEIRRARRYRLPLALLSFDIDRFKAVNDTYGYPVGDVALRTVADTARAVLRASDILVRSGGEEFHIIAPHTSAIDGLKMAEKVRMAIEQAEIPGCDHVTVSLGVAQLGEQESGDSLTQRTDAALARAKRAGRNCVELAMQ
jgi:diguanylate cyclase (GGDEF)-like protein